MNLPWTLKIEEECDSTRELQLTLQNPNVRYCVVVDATGQRIATGWHDPKVLRLVAAAPDLLAALEKSVSAMKAPLDDWKGEVERAALYMARGAIIKAMG